MEWERHVTGDWNQSGKKTTKWTGSIGSGLRTRPDGVLSSWGRTR